MENKPFRNQTCKTQVKRIDHSKVQHFNHRQVNEYRKLSTSLQRYISMLVAAPMLPSLQLLQTGSCWFRVMKLWSLHQPFIILGVSVSYSSLCLAYFQLLSFRTSEVFLVHPYLWLLRDFVIGPRYLMNYLEYFCQHVWAHSGSQVFEEVSLPFGRMPSETKMWEKDFACGQTLMCRNFSLDIWRQSLELMKRQKLLRNASRWKIFVQIRIIIHPL